MMNNPTTPAAWGIQLSKLWTQSGQNFPIDVRAVALEVTKIRFPSDPITVITGHGVPGVDGMLHKRTRGDWCISFDETAAKGRANFTVGHELGHYLLHRSIRDRFECGQVDVMEYEDRQSKAMESEANEFASFLLMPADDFRTQINGQPLTLDLLGHCADRYDTSFTATALKWIQLADQPAMLVVAREDFILWSYPNRSARKLGVYLPPATPVPQTSLDYYYSQGIARQNVARRVPRAVWHPELEASELLILSDQFELQIFLVQFPMADLIEHSEQEDQDSFSYLSEKSLGLNWKK